MTALVLLLLLAPPRASPTPTPGPAIYVVVEKDGSVVRLEKAPSLKGTTYVGRLWPSGQLVSIPVSKVDDRKTAAANAPGRSTAPSSETDIGTRYGPAGPQTPLGDKMKLKGGRRKVERRLQGTPTPGTASGESGGGTENTGAASVGVDRNGHGEAWWKGRAAPLREELADAEAELKLSSDERKRFDEKPPPAGEETTLARQHLVAREERARQRVAAAKKRLDELSAEAAKAGAPPGWVR